MESFNIFATSNPVAVSFWMGLARKYHVRPSPTQYSSKIARTILLLRFDFAIQSLQMNLLFDYGDPMGGVENIISRSNSERDIFLG